MNKSINVLIAGGGIGGLTAALCLLDKGINVTVLEQANELKALGAGIQLSANATRVLFQLGLGDELYRVTIKPSKKCIRHWQTGQEWELFDLGNESLERYGYPYMMLYRPDIHDILIKAINERSPGALKLSSKVVDIKQNKESVEVKVGTGKKYSADVLIGADGVHSFCREKLIAKDDPIFSGCIAWRGVIPIEKLPQSMRSQAGVNWVGPGAHVVHYPIHAGKMVSFTGVVEKEGWFVESWTEQGSIEECLSDFNGWHEDIQAMVNCLDSPLRWAMMLREPLANWTNQRVTLLGDAAHPTLPFLAQGAAMAIEDGMVLARALDKYQNSPEKGLQVYQGSRIGRTTKIVNGSSDNTKRFHNNLLNDVKNAQEFINKEWEEKKVRARYDWLFEYEPENVPLVSI